MSDIHGLSGAYAIDAVTEEERRAFERHLADCATCRDDVAQMREAAAQLTWTATAEPPAAVRDSILSTIATTRQLPPLTPSRQRQSSVLRRVVLAAAAAVVVVVGIGVGATQPWKDDAPAVPLTATERVLEASDAQRISLVLGDGARATVIRSVSQARAVLVTEDMPAAPDGKVYVVWLQDDEGAMVPAGAMPPGTDQTLLLTGNAATATAAGITVESDPDTQVPTSDPLALFEF